MTQTRVTVGGDDDQLDVIQPVFEDRQPDDDGQPQPCATDFGGVEGLEDLLPHVKAIGDLELVQGLTLPPAPWLDKRFLPHLKVNAFYLDPVLEKLVN